MVNWIFPTKNRQEVMSLFGFVKEEDFEGFLLDLNIFPDQEKFNLAEIEVIKIQREQQIKDLTHSVKTALTPFLDNLPQQDKS